MKYSYLIIGLLLALVVSCVKDDFIDSAEPAGLSRAEKVFYATIDDQAVNGDTRTFANSDLQVRWYNDDRVTIYDKSTYGEEYAFQGESGQASGPFKRVPTDFVVLDENLSSIYAVYPHQDNTTIDQDGVISYTLPAMQTYEADSFGDGANVMVAKSDDNKLKFKNVGGYLSIKLYGNVSVSSVYLKGNNNERLAGASTISFTTDNGVVIPTISVSDAEPVQELMLYCKEPVELKASSDEYTEFWLVLPPVTFTKGFTITVTTPDSKYFTKSTSKEISIARSAILRMAPIEVKNLSTPSSKPVISSLSLTGVVDPVSGDVVSKFCKQETANDSFTLTMPTVTDFSKVVLNFQTKNATAVMADGQEIISGQTPIDASEPVTLMVARISNGTHIEKRYTLVARNTGLPVVRITMDGFSLSDIEGKSKYQQGDGTWVDERVWMPEDGDLEKSASISVEYPDGTTALSDKNGNSLDIVATQIKGRGNASWKYNKKPYALKLGSKARVLGMKEHKRWILLANWKDRTLLRNEAALWLSRQISDVLKSPSFPYSVHGQFVELEINGEFRGNYYLCEQIKIDKNRLNINEFKNTDITGGYLMEIDNNYDEPYKFLSGFYETTSGPQGLKYMFKEPDEDLPDDAFNFMKGYIQEMETLIKDIPNGNYGYRDYIDMDSAIWFMLVNELTGNGDFFNSDGGVGTTWYGPHSTYMYKDRDLADGIRSKLFMGPVWDFDYLTFYNKSGGWQSPSRSNKWVGVAEDNYYYYYFTQDPTFRARISELWSSYKPLIESAMLTHIDEMKDQLLLSEPINTAMWGYSNTNQDQGQNGDNGDTFETAVSKMKSAFTTKLNFMDTKIAAGNYRN